MSAKLIKKKRISRSTVSVKEGQTSRFGDGGGGSSKEELITSPWVKEI